MKKQLVASSIALVLSSQAGLTLAVEESKDENKIVVSANRIQQDINDTLTDVTIIDRAEIEQKQPQSLVELLVNVSGVDFAQTGGHGQDTSIFVRGTNSNQVLILIDGVRVGSATLGNKAVATIPMAQIERVEIVKGPRAAIWGSDAIGGVIQIFTRNLQSGESRYALTLGSNNTLELDAAIGFGDETVNSTITYSNKSSDGFDARIDAETDDDGYENESLAIKGEYNYSQNSQFDWLVQSDRGETEFDSPWTTDNVAEYNNHHWKVGYQFESETWNHQVALNGSRDSSRGFETRREQLNYHFANQLSSQLSISGGLDIFKDDVSKSSTDYQRESRQTDSFYLSTNYVGDQFLLDLAVRTDDVEAVANETTSNLGLGYRVNGQHLISLNFGEGFKAPTFNDLYFPFGGNPDLTFETSENTELVYKGQFGQSRLTVSVYESDIENLIQWIPDANGIWAPQNVGAVEVSGVDLSYQIRSGDYSHKFTADDVDAIDLATNAALIRRAKNHFGYEVSFAKKSLDWFLQVQYVGKRPDTDFQTFAAIELDSFTRLNAGIGYAVSDNFKLQLKVNDLTDEAPTIVSGFNPTEREFYLTASYLVE